MTIRDLFLLPPSRRFRPDEEDGVVEIVSYDTKGVVKLLFQGD